MHQQILCAFSGGATGTAFYDSVIADNPLSYWRLAETSGATAFAVGSTPANGAYNGSPTRGQPTLCGDAGDFSIALDGISQHVNCGTTGNLNKAGGFTWEAIVIPGAAITSNSILSHGYQGGYLRVNSSMHIDWISSQVALRGTSTGTLTVGSRAIVGITVDVSGAFTFYINGAASGAGTGPADYNLTTQAFCIGCDRTGGDTPTDFFQGRIDEPVVYGTALSASRMLAHAQAAGLA